MRGERWQVVSHVPGGPATVQGEYRFRWFAVRHAAAFNRRIARLDSRVHARVRPVPLAGRWLKP